MNSTVMLRSAAALLAVQLMAGAAQAQSADSAAPQADSGSTESKSSAKPIVVYTLAGLGIASLGTGAYFWLDSYSKGKDVDDFRAGRPSGFCKPGETAIQCTAAQDRLLGMQDDQDSAALKAQLFQAAGSLLVVSAVLTDYFWKDTTNHKEARQSVPLTTRTSGHSPLTPLQ